MRTRVSVRLWCALMATLLTMAITSLAFAQGDDSDTEVSDAWIDWTHWTPSVAVSGAFNGRDVDSTIWGWIFGLRNYEIVVDNKGDPYAGPVVPIELRVLAPEFKKIPGEPRLYVNGGYMLSFKARELGARNGLPPSFWGLQLGGVPQVYVEQQYSESGRWFVGGGVRVRLPVDTYPTFIRLAVDYSEQDMDVVTAYLSPFATGNAIEVSEFTIRNIIPGIGVDVEVGRLAQMSVEVAFDVGVGVPLNDGVIFHDLNNFDVLFTETRVISRFEYGVDVTAAVGLRLSWVGP